MSINKRRSLGKGLGALIPMSDRKENKKGLFNCSVDELVPNSDQPRQSFNEQKLKELTESIKSKGIIQPLVVRAVGSGRYQIVAGERRWRAARLAGLKSIPVVVEELSDSEVLEIALIENIQREDLNPLEEAEAYKQLLDKHGLTQEQLSKRVGRQRSTVANSLRLLKLPNDIQEFLLTGEIAMGHARALLGVEKESAQRALARKVVREALSVRSLEDLVRDKASKSESVKRKHKKSGLSSSQRNLVEGLQRRFGTKIELQTGKKGGKLVIHYFSDQELDHIVELLDSN
jgi:ParB family chromosome partitioning protein